MLSINNRTRQWRSGKMQSPVRQSFMGKFTVQVQRLPVDPGHALAMIQGGLGLGVDHGTRTLLRVFLLSIICALSQKKSLNFKEKEKY